MKILVVEDERAISEVIVAYLKKEGLETDVAPDGAKAIEKFKNNNFDLVILDLMLPIISGEEVCREIRRVSEVPIIMLTAKGGETDVIAGLDVGADDYVIKPFSPRVLMARVRAQLRGYAPSGVKKVIKIDDVEVDSEAFEIKREGKMLSVTRNEFLVFAALASKPDKTFSRDELIASAFGDDYEGFDRTIDTYVKNLRRKVGDRYIKTVHGFGYRISAEQ